MHINDWTKSILLTKKILHNLIQQGIACTHTTNVTADNQQTICFHVLDKKENLYRQYDSGVHETFEEMETALKNLETTILNNYKK